MERGGQRRVEICGFVSGAWHSLPPLKSCDRLASLVWCHFPGLGGGGHWHNTMNECTQWSFNFISKAVIAPCPSHLWHGENRLVFFSLFVPPLPLVLCPALTWQSTWGDYVGYLGVSTWLSRTVFKCCSCWNSCYVFLFWRWVCLFQWWSKKRHLCLSVCLAHPLTSLLDVGGRAWISHGCQTRPLLSLPKERHRGPVRGSWPGHDNLLRASGLQGGKLCLSGLRNRLMRIY